MSDFDRSSNTHVTQVWDQEANTLHLVGGDENRNGTSDTMQLFKPESAGESWNLHLLWQFVTHIPGCEDTILPAQKNKNEGKERHFDPVTTSLMHSFGHSKSYCHVPRSGRLPRKSNNVAKGSLTAYNNDLHSRFLLLTATSVNYNVASNFTSKD